MGSARSKNLIIAALGAVCALLAAGLVILLVSSGRNVPSPPSSPDLPRTAISSTNEPPATSIDGREAPATAAVDDSTARPASYYADLAQVQMRHGDIAAAVDLFGKAIGAEKIPQKQANLLYLLSQARERQGKLKEAVLALEKGIGLVDAGVEQARFYYALGRLHERMGDLPKAQASFEFVAKTGGQGVAVRSARQHLLQIYKKTGKLAGIVADYEERLKRNPDDEGALEGLVQVHSEIERDAEGALPYYERLAARRPDDTRLARDLAGIYAGAGRAKDAAAIYERLGKESPRDQAYYFEQIGRVWGRAGKRDKAMSWAKRIVEVAPKRPSSYVSYASICFLVGRHRDGITALEKAVDMMPKGTARDELRLRLVEVLEEAGELERARSICEAVISHSDAKDVLRRARFILGRIRERTEATKADVDR